MDAISPPDAAFPTDAQRSRTRIGRVVSASGAHLVLLLDDVPYVTERVRIGALVCISADDTQAFGLVQGLSNPMPRSAGEGLEPKLAEISLLGEVQFSSGSVPSPFRRGISSLPPLDAVAWLADHGDTALVFALPGKPSVVIGSVHQDALVPARVSVDDLLCKHFAVLGTTGTGKSCGLTVILKRLLECNPNGHVLLLDPHGEYGAAFGEQAEHLATSNFRLPYWLFNFEELTGIVFGHEIADMAVEATYLREMVLAAKISMSRGSSDHSWITVDSPVPYMVSELLRLIDVAVGSLDGRNNVGAYLRLKARLALLQTDRRYALVFDTGISVRDNLSHLLGRIFRLPSEGKPIAILDLSSVPAEILNVVVGVVCRLAFDLATVVGHRSPLLLVCEEAHRYAPHDSSMAFGPAKRALSRIAKEGRKYGVALGVVSQRASELDATILSQCNTVFAFRMSNENDQEIIQASLSEASAPMFAALPSLGNGEAIAIGEGVPVPMRLRFHALPDGHRPRSMSVPFSSRWQHLDDGAAAYTPPDTGDAAEVDRFVQSLRRGL